LRSATAFENGGRGTQPVETVAGSDEESALVIAPLSECYYPTSFADNLSSLEPLRLRDGFYQTGIYVAKILAGAKPSDLPVLQSAKFELAISLRTAKSLGIDVPASLLALADRVVE
jgi:ABC transporter substrate binding protein